MSLGSSFGYLFCEGPLAVQDSAGALGGTSMSKADFSFLLSLLRLRESQGLNTAWGTEFLRLEEGPCILLCLFPSSSLQGIVKATAKKDLASLVSVDLLANAHCPRPITSPVSDPVCVWLSFSPVWKGLFMLLVCFSPLFIVFNPACQ